MVSLRKAVPLPRPSASLSIAVLLLLFGNATTEVSAQLSEEASRQFHKSLLNRHRDRHLVVDGKAEVLVPSRFAQCLAWESPAGPQLLMQCHGTVFHRALARRTVQRRVPSSAQNIQRLDVDFDDQPEIVFSDFGRNRLAVFEEGKFQEDPQLVELPGAPRQIGTLDGTIVVLGGKGRLWFVRDAKSEPRVSEVQIPDLDRARPIALLSVGAARLLAVYSCPNRAYFIEGETQITEAPGPFPGLAEDARIREAYPWSLNAKSDEVDGILLRLAYSSSAENCEVITYPLANGSFERGESLRVGPWAAYFLAVDANGDDVTDLAVADYDEDLQDHRWRVLLGTKMGPTSTIWMETLARDVFRMATRSVVEISGPQPCPRRMESFRRSKRD